MVVVVTDDLVVVVAVRSDLEVAVQAEIVVVDNESVDCCYYNYYYCEDDEIDSVQMIDVDMVDVEQQQLMMMNYDEVALVDGSRVDMM